jgi:hypothetical protein
MDNDKILHFVAEKIEDLGAAILYCYSRRPLRINNTIIHSSKVDRCGCISFFIDRPRQLVSEFEKEFPVGLNYFKKGKNYFLKVLGKATIINDPEELAYEEDLTEEEINQALTTHILIKVRIITVNFYDNNFEKKNVLLKKFSSIFSKIFTSVGSASGSYNVTPRPSLENYGF